MGRRLRNIEKEIEMIEALDPGVLDDVCRLRAAGFRTLDSGDGYSKEPDAIELPFPHIVIQTTKWNAEREAELALRLLGPGWESTYLPPEDHAVGDDLHLIMLAWSDPGPDDRPF